MVHRPAFTGVVYAPVARCSGVFCTRFGLTLTLVLVVLLCMGHRNKPETKGMPELIITGAMAGPKCQVSLPVRACLTHVADCRALSTRPSRRSPEVARAAVNAPRPVAIAVQRRNANTSTGILIET